MTSMDGEDLQRLWSLIDDLTNQLQTNRQVCESLQHQADQLRGQAMHSGTGFALRRFNTDVSKETFESELEALNVHLVKEHLMITHENKQQAMLLREYENTLETIMAKFRTFSHSTQQHTLRLTQHYETLLSNTTQTSAEQTLAAETAFSGTLTHLGGLVRRAMQSLDGEDQDQDTDSKTERVSKKKHPWAADPRWFGSGGYTGTSTDPAAQRAEHALEQLTEEERLRLENETLRELLLLKDRSDALVSNAVTTSDASDAADTPASAAVAADGSDGTGAVRRMSLTVDQASIAAEASGQPPLKALSISSTLKPGQKTPSPISSPTQLGQTSVSARDKQEKLIEEAILADETDNTSSALVDNDNDDDDDNDDDQGVFEDGTSTKRGRQNSAIATRESDSLNAIEDVDAIHAEFQPDPQPDPQSTQQVLLTRQAPSTARETLSSSSSAQRADVDDEPTPNLVAEAGPPALVSTGLPDTATHTSVTSVSGPEPTSPPHTASSTTTIPAAAAAAASTTVDSTQDATATSTSETSSHPQSKPETEPAQSHVIPAEPTSQDYRPVTAATTDSSTAPHPQLAQSPPTTTDPSDSTNPSTQSAPSPDVSSSS